MNGGGLTFGYRVKDQRLEIDETTAPIVVEIFTRYADGEKMTDIAKDLTLRGVRTSKGNKITLNVVHYVLKNRRYIGEYKFRDMVIHDAIPPIVSEELFNRVQEIMARNQKAPAMRKAEDDYILTTRLFCGKCGTFMVGESGKSHTGTVHRYYKCSHAKRKMGCDKKPVKKDWIEDAVIHYIMKIVMDDELIDHIADAILNILAQENSKLPQLNARLKEIEAGIQNMLNAIQQGILTPSTKERLEALEQEREEIKVAIYSEELQKPKITKEHIAFWISKFRDTNLTDVASRKRLVESFVNAVFVYDDKVVFTFNYKDGSKTATIDEINAELGSDLEGISPPAKRTCIFYAGSFCYERKEQRAKPRARKVVSGRRCARSPHRCKIRPPRTRKRGGHHPKKGGTKYGPFDFGPPRAELVQCGRFFYGADRCAPFAARRAAGRGARRLFTA